MTGAAQAEDSEHSSVVVEPTGRASDEGLVSWSAFIAVGIWSGMSPVTKYALEWFPALAYTALRPAIACALIFAILRVRHVPLGVDRGDLPRLVLAGTGALSISQLSYVVGLDRTSVSHAVILLSSSPLVAALWRWITGARPSVRAIVGLVGGFFGVTLLMLGSGGTGGATLLGDVITFGGAIAWMGATVWPSPLLPKYGSLKVTGWLFLTSLIVTLPIGATAFPSTIHHPPATVAWLSLFYGAVVGNLVGNTLWQRAVQTVGSARTIPYLYLEPLGSLVLAAAFLGDRLSLIQGLGGALALVGVVLVPKR